jgi:hypothetical protein
VLKVWLAIFCSLTLNHTLIIHSRKDRGLSELKQGLEGLGMFGAPAVHPWAVGWVYIPNPKTSYCSLKTSCYNMYWCSTVAHCVKIRGTSIALKSSTSHLTENTITFTLNSVFSDFGLSKKLVLRAIQPNQEQALISTSLSVVLMHFSHVSTWVR